jgi:FtsP/CotA-like multicopper oxidase with cupredoxin domain
MTRNGPDGQPEKIWKDTILVTKGQPAIELRSRYEDFDGTFVLHCHILNHEDKGMMELVEITAEKPVAVHAAKKKKK